MIGCYAKSSDIFVVFFPPGLLAGFSRWLCELKFLLGFFSLLLNHTEVAMIEDAQGLYDIGSRNSLVLDEKKVFPVRNVCRQ